MDIFIVCVEGASFVDDTLWTCCNAMDLDIELSVDILRKIFTILVYGQM